MQPVSSSAVVETREGSNTLSYQWVYLWFEMPACSWHGTFTVYNHKVRTSWDKSIEPLHSAENELEPSRCTTMCCLILKLFLTALHDVEFYSVTVLSEWPRGLLLIFAVYVVYAMEPNKSEESGEMYSPDNNGEYMPEVGPLSFSIQGLSNALTALETVMKVQPPPEEFALQLEVMMADHPGHPHPPTFLWNVGMVLHVLKSDPTLRDLKHVQVDGSGMAYMFFVNKQGHQGLTHAMKALVGEAFSEWISCSTHFAVNPLPLAEGWHCVIAASEKCRQQS